MQHRKLYFLLTLVGITPFFLNGYINSKIHQNPYLYWSFEILIWVVIPLAVVGFLTRIPDFRFSDLGFRVGIWGRNSVELLALICILFAFADYWIYAFLIEGFVSVFGSNSLFQYSAVIPDDRVHRVIVIGYFAVSAGLVEEFFFRGMIFKTLAGLKYQVALFVLISPVLFSLIHWESGLANLISTYAFGVFSAAAFLILRNIWPLVIGHIVTDVIWFSG